MAGIKGFIFDLDGTLLDSASLWDDIDRKFLGSHGIDMPSGYADAISSMSFAEAAEYSIKLFSLDYQPDELVVLWNSMAKHGYMHDIRLFDGAELFLRIIREKGMRIVAATDLGRSLAEASLASNGVLDLFDSISSTAESGVPKSMPDVYIRASDSVSLLPSECIVFEDCKPGIESALMAGFAVFDVLDAPAYGFSPVSEGLFRELAEKFSLIDASFVDSDTFIEVNKNKSSMRRRRDDD